MIKHNSKHSKKREGEKKNIQKPNWKSQEKPQESLAYVVQLIQSLSEKVNNLEHRAPNHS